MNKQNRMFRWVIVAFALLLAYASYDIASRTTFPGSRPQLKERIKRDILDETTEQAIDSGVASPSTPTPDSLATPGTSPKP